MSFYFNKKNSILLIKGIYDRNEEYLDYVGFLNVQRCKKKTQIEPYSIEMYKKHFDIDLLLEFSREKNYYFNDSHNIILLFLKFENITEWNKIINYHLPYKFVLHL